MFLKILLQHHLDVHAALKNFFNIFQRHIYTEINFHQHAGIILHLLDLQMAQIILLKVIIVQLMRTFCSTLFIYFFIFRSLTYAYIKYHQDNDDRDFENDV